MLRARVARPGLTSSPTITPAYTLDRVIAVALLPDAAELKGAG